MEVDRVAVVLGQGAHGVQHTAVFHLVRSRKILVQLGVLLAGGAGQIVAAVDGHTQQPGFQVFLALEAAIVAQQLFENILHHIFRIGGAAAVVHGGSEHRVTVSLHGQRKNLVFGQLSHSSMLL